MRSNELRPVLAAVGALLALGASAIALREAPAPSDPLVNALGADELEKFAVVEMADAVERVARASAENR